MDWIKDLCRSALRYWWALMSCAIFTILGIYALVMHRDNLWLIRSSFILAGVFVIIAIALAWRDEHRKLLAEKTKNGKPDFKVDISEFVRNADHDSDLGCTFFAKLSIVNRSLSAATVKSVYVKTSVEPGKFKASLFGSHALVRHKPVPVSFPLEGTMTQPVTSRIDDVLQKLNMERLERGVHKEGWLKFSDVPYAYKSQTFDIYVEDAYGEAHGPFHVSVAMEAGYVETR